MTSYFDLFRPPSWTVTEVQKFKRLKHLVTAEAPVLDVGARNPLGIVLGKQFGVKADNTSGDLNWHLWWIMPGMPYKTVWCFDVIEHLLNPLQFLSYLHKITAADARIYVTYPMRPRMFWGPGHFHEYDRQRFAVLLEAAGLEVVRYEKFVVRWPWRAYFRGLRSLLRLTPIGWCKVQFYELRIKRAG